MDGTIGNSIIGMISHKKQKNILSRMTSHNPSQRLFIHFRITNKLEVLNITARSPQMILGMSSYPRNNKTNNNPS